MKNKARSSCSLSQGGCSMLRKIDPEAVLKRCGIDACGYETDSAYGCCCRDGISWHSTILKDVWWFQLLSRPTAHQSIHLSLTLHRSIILVYNSSSWRHALFTIPAIVSTPLTRYDGYIQHQVNKCYFISKEVICIIEMQWKSLIATEMYPDAGGLVCDEIGQGPGVWDSRKAVWWETQSSIWNHFLLF